MSTKKASEHSHALEKEFAKIFAQAPHLPTSWRDFLVQIAPWIVIIMGVFSVVSLLGLLRFFFSPLGRMLEIYRPFGSVGVFLLILIAGIFIYLCFTAWNPLKDKKKSGWNRLFWMQGVFFVYILFSTVGMIGFLSGLVGLIISLYLIFEIRNHYN